MTHIRAASHDIVLLSSPSPCSPFFPLPLYINYPFFLLGNPLFGDRGANVHPHLSLVGDRLPTPFSLTSPFPPQGLPQFMLHVSKDDITKSVMLSDTLIGRQFSNLFYCKAVGHSLSFLHFSWQLSAYLSYKPATLGLTFLLTCNSFLISPDGRPALCLFILMAGNFLPIFPAGWQLPT